MTITVCGKQHMKGTSKKTGYDYDFIIVHYMGKAYGVEGVYSDARAPLARTFNTSFTEF